MARLGRESTVALRDGREAVIRSARPATPGRSAGCSTPSRPRPRSPCSCGWARSAREWRRRIAAAAERDTSLFLCAWLGERLVGDLGMVVDAHPASSHVLVVGMSVARDCRGLGVGGAMLERALEWAGELGALKVELSVFAHNASAISFYERHGFAREGLRRRQLVRAGEYHDEVLMARFLDPEP